jgi:hypothetical protein
MISIVDTGLGQCSMYRDERGVWNGVRWDGQCSIVLHFAETDEKKGALL